MFAQITKDVLDLTDTLGPEFDRTGKVIIGTTPPTEGLLRVRLLDDDREIYYYGLATDDALEDFLNWAMADAGCTILQVYKTGYQHCATVGTWEDVIS
jgi:hypothetical protein